MNSVSSTKVALCFLRVCKILRTGEIGEGGGESECSQTAPQTPSRGQSLSRVAEGARSKHFFSKTRCPMQPPSPLQRENLTPVAYASARPGDGEGVVGKHSARSALKIHFLAGCSGACLHPPNHSGHQGAGPLAPAWRPCRPSALGREHGQAPGPASVSASAAGGQREGGGGRGGTRQRHLEAVVLGPGEGALGHRKIRSSRGVDRRLQTLGGGGGIRGGLRFQTPLGVEQESASTSDRSGKGAPGHQAGVEWGRLGP